jgi:hypothetical protein
MAKRVKTLSYRGQNGSWRSPQDGLKSPKIEVKMQFSSTGQFLSKSAAIFAIFDVFSPELQYI